MSKVATLSSQEAHYQALAQGFLAETQRILRQLAAERRAAFAEADRSRGSEADEPAGDDFLRRLLQF